MAAYAALASLAQITDLNRIQNKFLFSIDAKQKVRSIHEYVTSLLSFLEDCPQKDSQRDGKMRDVAYKTEDIIESLMYLPIGNRHSTDVLEEQLRCVTEEFGLMAGQVMEDRPAAASSSSSSSSRLAPFGNDPVIGLEDDLIAMKYRPPHKMRPMDDYQSWELIKQKVFPNSDCPPNLEDVGKKIAQSCTGLPLAVVLVAGLLSSVNVTPSSWEEIAENVRQVVCRGSEDVLSLSYTHLPHHLRPCFLILGGFPEDRSIVASRLIKLWVAEGFLKHEDGCCKSLEEKAEEYLEDLIKRNLVDVTSKKSDGKIKRVLEAFDITLWEPHTEIFELYHLRYLALKQYMGDIPSAISNLVNLQTLIISKQYSSGFKTRDHFRLPIEIWEMLQLRHVFLGDSHIMPHPPNFLVSNLPLENLQTLFPLEDLVWYEKLLQIIPIVKKLGLVYFTDQDYRLHHLKFLHQLEKLHIYGHSGFSWRRQNPCFPHKLKKLTLLGGGYPWKYMSVIGSLPNLKVLKLLGNACCGDTWKTTDEEFPQLIYLLIEESSLLHWLTESSPFPMLKFLVLRSCEGRLKIPEAIGEIATLELIQVHDCSSSILESAKQIKKDQENCGNDTLQVRCNITRIIPRSNAAKETDETPDSYAAVVVNLSAPEGMVLDDAGWSESDK
ncbi:hypothetical protein SASPL_141154 [Salvia splendens]|uniref:Disease resistance protein winged helix domain-containing protein n=1 Tax=Salvia splendens TaxID=180675 RepID=A0A8X8ZCK9_SALSN|nr:hypothetical protein SASPL_141154 [Salvia splendens]